MEILSRKWKCSEAFLFLYSSNVTFLSFQFIQFFYSSFLSSLFYFCESKSIITLEHFNSFSFHSTYFFFFLFCAYNYCRCQHSIEMIERMCDGKCWKWNIKNYKHSYTFILLPPPLYRISIKQKITKTNEVNYFFLSLFLVQHFYSSLFEITGELLLIALTYQERNGEKKNSITQYSLFYSICLVTKEKRERDTVME